MGLHEKMFNVMNETAGLEKNLQVGTGKSSYKAIGEAEVLNMMKPLFKKHHLIIFPVDGDITEHNSTFEAEYEGKTTIKTRNVTQLKVKFKIVDIDTGESECLMSFGNGADSQDKGSGKAFTYALKSVLSKTFMLFSGEDTDNEHSDDIGNQGFKKPLQKAPTLPPTLPPKQPADEPKPHCKKCNDEISQKVHDYSVKLYKAPLCQKCQEIAKKHYEQQKQASGQ